MRNSRQQGRRHCSCDWEHRSCAFAAATFIEAASLDIPGRCRPKATASQIHMVLASRRTITQSVRRLRLIWHLHVPRLVHRRPAVRCDLGVPVARPRPLLADTAILVLVRRFRGQGGRSGCPSSSPPWRQGGKPGCPILIRYVATGWAGTRSLSSFPHATKRT